MISHLGSDKGHLESTVLKTYAIEGNYLTLKTPPFNLPYYNIDSPLVFRPEEEENHFNEKAVPSFRIKIDIDDLPLFSFNMQVNGEDVLKCICFYKSSKLFQRMEILPGESFYFYNMEFIELWYKNDKIVTRNNEGHKSYAFGLVEKLNDAVSNEKYEQAAEFHSKLNAWINSKEEATY